MADQLAASALAFVPQDAAPPAVYAPQDPTPPGGGEDAPAKTAVKRTSRACDMCSKRKVKVRFPAFFIPISTTPLYSISLCNIRDMAVSIFT